MSSLQQRSQYGEHVPQITARVVTHVDNDPFDLLVEQELVEILAIDCEGIQCLRLVPDLFAFISWPMIWKLLNLR